MGKRKREVAPELPDFLEWLTPKGQPGVRVAVLRMPPDDAPEDVREGVVRNRIAAVEGVCPCGGRATVLDPDLMTAPGEVAEANAMVWHTEDCPGYPANLRAAVRRWNEARGL